MVIEPFELQGKTIKECFMHSNNSEVILRFEDGVEIKITPTYFEDEFNGDLHPNDELQIIKS